MASWAEHPRRGRGPALRDHPAGAGAPARRAGQAPPRSGRSARASRHRPRRDRHPDAGHRARGRGRRRRRGRARSGRVRRRGDEDGERDHVAARGHRLRALRGAGAARLDRPGHLPGHAGRRLTERSAPFCADLSRENDEPLAATASRIDNWFLIEYRGLWARDALTGSGLSDQVKHHLRDQVGSAPHGRLLFVRRPDRRGRPELLAFTAASRPGETAVTRTDFEAYDDLRGIDLSAGAPAGHPLFLVCTHGKHDPCCARYGRPLYEALRDELEPDWAWQVSHIGGDRFAGNLVCLPEGLYYGRVDRETAGSVLDEHLAGRILTTNYRGRSIYTFPVQAA